MVQAGLPGGPSPVRAEFAAFVFPALRRFVLRFFKPWFSSFAFAKHVPWHPAKRSHVRGSATIKPRRPRMTPIPARSELLEAGAPGRGDGRALAERFGVTLQTVRRDDEARRGRPAGALPRRRARAAVPTTENIAYRQRQHLNADAKRASRARWWRGAGELLADDQHRHHHRGGGARAAAPPRPARHHQQPERGGILSDNPDCEVIVAGGVVRRATAASSARPRWTSSRQFRSTSG